MYCSAGFTFTSSCSWPEMFERLRRIGFWAEWWTVGLGDTLVSLDTTDHWPRRLEKLTIYWDVASERWTLDTHFDCEGNAAGERWSVFAWRILDTLTVIDATSIERLTMSSSEGASAWLAFDFRLGL